MEDPWEKTDPGHYAGTGHGLIPEFIETQVVDSDFFWGLFPLPSGAEGPASPPRLPPGQHRRRSHRRAWWRR